MEGQLFKGTITITSYNKIFSYRIQQEMRSFVILIGILLFLVAFLTFNLILFMKHHL